MLIFGLAVALLAGAGPDPGWRQILSVPRVGERLRSITVDPEDPDRLFVGTEAGTLLLSDDGGLTWEEVEIEPRVVQERSASVPAPGLPELGATTPSSFATAARPPFRTSVGRVPVPSVADAFPVRPDFFWAGVLATTRPPSPNLLSAVLSSRYYETQPVKRIALCKGGIYEVIVATSDAVYGSQDGGHTFVRLFANAGHLYLDHATCSPADPNHVAVATQIGLFLSTDGGLSFDQDLSAWPGRSATAVAYAPPAAAGDVFLFSASGSELTAGKPGTPEGLASIYPTDPATAPWATIRWIAADRDGGVYLATDDGARLSRDRGKSWEVVALNLLDRQQVAQVEVGQAEDGRRRVVALVNVRPTSIRGKPVGALQDSVLYASDDGGLSFFPFFSGYTMRSLRQVAAVEAQGEHPAGWWVATSGEVWTTFPRRLRSTPDPAAVRWARRRIAVSPSMDEVIGSALTRAELSNEALDRLGRRYGASGFMPTLSVLVTANDRPLGLALAADGPAVGGRLLRQLRERDLDREDFGIFVQLGWDTATVLKNLENASSDRPRLHRMRRQLELAVQDAFHERSVLLLELAEGLPPLEAASTMARVEAVEAMLAVWLGGPLPGMEDEG